MMLNIQIISKKFYRWIDKAIISNNLALIQHNDLNGTITSVLSLTSEEWNPVREQTVYGRKVKVKIRAPWKNIQVLLLCACCGCRNVSKSTNV